MRIAHLGTFDVANYGDLLFPLIAEWRVPDAEWTHISPVGIPSAFSDAIITQSYDKIINKDFDAVIIGGGNIIYLRESLLDSYFSKKSVAYPSLSLGGVKLAKINSAKLFINGASLRKCKLGILEKFLLLKMSESASYATFRDDYSLNVLGPNAPFSRIIPDTVFDISRMWPLSQFDLNNGKKYISIHVNQRYGGNAKDTASALDDIISITGAELHLIPIGPCHGDLEYMYEIISNMNSKKIKAIKHLSLYGFAKEIAQSQIYIGSSMHGFITAASYGVPSLLVLNNNPMEKFIGLLDTLEAPKSVICLSWIDSAKKLNMAWSLSKDVREKIFNRLDLHWNYLRFRLFNDKKKLSYSKIFCFWRQLLWIAQVEVKILKVILWFEKKVKWYF